MTVIDKLSDRNGLIFNAIKLIIVNEGNMNPKILQWRLFQYGIFIDKIRLDQAISVMMEKKLIKNAEPVQKEPEAGIQQESPGHQASN